MRWFLTSSLLLLTFGAAWPAAAQTPEELYGEYMTPVTRAVLERFEEAERLAQEAQEAARARKTLLLALAGVIGLVPVAVTGRRVLRGKTWKENPSGTVRALCVSLLGGAVLFALNYGIFLLKIKMGDAFNTTLAFLLVAAMIAGSIFLLRKKTD